MGKQGDDEHHGLGRSAQPIEARAFRGAECLLARGTQEPLVFARVDTNIALTDVASGRTRQSGAKYCCWGP